MKLKKFGSLCIIVGLSVLTFAGCNKTPNPEQPTDATGTEQDTTAAVENEEVVKTLYNETLFDTMDYTKYITIADYSGLKSLQAAEVTDEAVIAEMQNYAAYTSVPIKITDREVAEGDMVNCTINDGTTQLLEIFQGAGSYGEEFDKEILGMKSGETKTINIKVGDSVKEAEVTVNHIVQYTVSTEVNDEFVNNLTGGIYKTVDEFSDYIRGYLTENEQSNAVYNKLKEIIDASEFRDIDSFVDELYNFLMEGYKDYAEESGIDFEELVTTNYGFESKEDFEKELKANAEQVTKQKIAIYCIASAEGIKPTDEEYKSYADTLCASYSYPTITELLEEERVEDVRYYSVMDKFMTTYRTLNFPEKAEN